MKYGVKKEAQKKTKKEKDSTPVPSSGCPQDVVLLGVQESSHQGSSSGAGPSKVLPVQEVKTASRQEDLGNRSHSSNRKATYRFLRVGYLPGKDVHKSPTAPLPTLPQGKNSK